MKRKNSIRVIAPNIDFWFRIDDEKDVEIMRLAFDAILHDLQKALPQPPEEAE